MDIGTIIMGIILIAIVVVPMVLLGRKGKKTKHKLLDLLTIFANQKNCQITEHEACGDFVIGLDNRNNFVFFIKVTGEDYETNSVNIAETKNCKSNIVSRTVSFNGRNDKVIERLSLSFIPKSNIIPAVELEFYNAEKSTQLVGELQALEKWQKIINDQIQGKKK